jgi:hypothetical protein
VKETLGLLPREHLVQPYFPIAADLQFDAGLVDTFLHGRDRSYSVPDCLALVATAGLVFQGWVTHDCYYPEMFAPLSSAVYAALNRLPEPELWAAMERLQTQNGCHTFIACRAERSRRQYTVDFSGREYLDYIPEFRHLVRVEGDHVVSLRGRIPLNRPQASLLHEVNGSRRISELVSRTVAAGIFTNRGEAEEFARDLFRSLWRLALMAFNLKQVAGEPK